MFKLMAGLDESAGGILGAAGNSKIVIIPSIKPFMSSGKLPGIHHLSAGGKCTRDFHILQVKLGRAYLYSFFIRRFMYSLNLNGSTQCDRS